MAIFLKIPWARSFVTFPNCMSCIFKSHFDNTGLPRGPEKWSQNFLSKFSSETAYVKWKRKRIKSQLLFFSYTYMQTKRKTNIIPNVWHSLDTYGPCNTRKLHFTLNSHVFLHSSIFQIPSQFRKQWRNKIPFCLLIIVYYIWIYPRDRFQPQSTTLSSKK